MTKKEYLEICERKYDEVGGDIGNITDGYHTFNELYHHRALLFASIVCIFSKFSWKSKKHNDGSMYDNMFIVGIETPEGSACYHYEMEYWDIFHCKEVETAPPFDGATPAETIDRIIRFANIAKTYTSIYQSLFINDRYLLTSSDNPYITP